MPAWRPQIYRKRGDEIGVDAILLRNAIATAEITLSVNPQLPPVFTLRHLAHLAGVDYGLLRAIVRREHEDPYQMFRIRKRESRSGDQRYRVIAVPDPGLLKVQRWITQRILAKVTPHPASTAYSKGDTLVAAAAPHCRCRWLIKLDVRNFFESINEIAAYRVFCSLGYQRLISFEMARLCTRLGRASARRTTDRWLSRSPNRHVIAAYATYRMGHLPQGAPTSPMLANLAVRRFDELLSEAATNHGLVYTRYADDLAFSTREDRCGRERCRHIIGQGYAIMGQFGLSPNATKTKVTPPGSRKIVLGLLVDGPDPRLPRDFKAVMRQHIHFLRRPGFGPAVHAATRGFTSIAGLKHHVFGLVNFAKQIEPAYGKACEMALATVDWPI